MSAKSAASGSSAGCAATGPTWLCSTRGVGLCNQLSLLLVLSLSLSLLSLSL